jgi:predicted ATPase
MERENKRIRKKYENAERARLIKLVDAAYDNDPRIQARRK